MPVRRGQKAIDSNRNYHESLQPSKPPASWWNIPVKIAQVPIWRTLKAVNCKAMTINLRSASFKSLLDPALHLSFKIPQSVGCRGTVYIYPLAQVACQCHQVEDRDYHKLPIRFLHYLYFPSSDLSLPWKNTGMVGTLLHNAKEFFNTNQKVLYRQNSSPVFMIKQRSVREQYLSFSSSLYKKPKMKQGHSV